MAPVMVAVNVPLIAVQLPVPPEIVTSGCYCVLKPCPVLVSETGDALDAAEIDMRAAVGCATADLLRTSPS